MCDIGGSKGNGSGSLGSAAIGSEARGKDAPYGVSAAIPLGLTPTAQALGRANYKLFKVKQAYYLSTRSKVRNIHHPIPQIYRGDNHH